MAIGASPSEKKFKFFSLNAMAFTPLIGTSIKKNNFFCDFPNALEILTRHFSICLELIMTISPVTGVQMHEKLPACEYTRCIHYFIHLFISHTTIHLFIHSFILPFICSSIHSFIYFSYNYSSIHLFIHSIIYPFICSSIHLFIHSFIHPFIYSSIHLFVHSIIHSFSHSIITLFIQ